MRSAVILCVSMIAINTSNCEVLDSGNDCLSKAQEQLQLDWSKKWQPLTTDCNSGSASCKRARNPYWGPKAADFFGEIFTDVLELAKNLFSWDSFKILISTFPFYVATRMIDEKIQTCFYDRQYHKNKNQMPGWCHDAAEWSIGVPIVFFGLQAFLSRDEELRETSKLFLVGMPFVIWTKDAIKKIRFKACLRPWNENFDCKKRSMGGFPSGHMAEATYAAVFFGMRYGPRYAIPLGLLAAGVGATFLSCNRHYASQLVAGVGFGAMFAVAASKVVDCKLGKDVEFGMTMQSNGNPAFAVSYRF